jgi:hypothetical protein
VPVAVVTVTVRAPAAAAASMAKLAVNDVALCTVVAVTVTPAPLTATLVAPVTKPVPVNVIDAVEPAVPAAGRIDASVGAADVGFEGAEGLLLPHAVKKIERMISAPASGALRRIVCTHFVMQLRPWCWITDHGEAARVE